MKLRIVCVGLIAILIASCQNNQSTSMINEQTIQQAISTIATNYPNADIHLAERGVRQVATLWCEEDGSADDFMTLVTANFAPSKEAKKALYDRLSYIFEQCNQSADLLNNTLQEPTVLLGASDPINVDWIISGYTPISHFAEDMFACKIAHICVLNFPNFLLTEKNALSADWSRLDWAYARMGDQFTSRVPGNVYAAYSQVLSNAENYIADYNIMMHNLRNEKGDTLWKEPMALLSHWNLRDELKSNYANLPNAQEKQEMIYQVMLRIIRQEVPDCVVNNDAYVWAPYSNEVTTKETPSASQPSTHPSLERYEHILHIFHLLQQIDKYHSSASTHLLRTFNYDLEIPLEEIESLFIQLLESREVAAVADSIRQRLGRDLRPYDIWYDGFKSRSTISEDILTAQTQLRYPTAKSFENDIDRILMELGFSSAKAKEVQSRIVVEAARGSGHARPCVGRNQPARLRTRVNNNGMDYKGYNIAVHELGHNVEEVLSLYDVDYYTLAGIPNTGFTEASAFLFQQRDMQFLGYGQQAMTKEATFDMIWSMYEIMGVSLVDIAMWKWLYAHPKADAQQLRDAVVMIAADVWNKYYASRLGEPDCPLLGIYSHMVGYALYLPGYPIGQLVQYQLEEHLAQCQTPSEFAAEYMRIYQQGRLTPDAWMRGAVGQPISVQPILKAVNKCL